MEIPFHFKYFQNQVCRLRKIAVLIKLENGMFRLMGKFCLKGQSGVGNRVSDGNDNDDQVYKGEADA